jgi:hypothetical protein
MTPRATDLATARRSQRLATSFPSLLPFPQEQGRNKSQSPVWLAPVPVDTP